MARGDRLFWWREGPLPNQPDLLITARDMGSGVVVTLDRAITVADSAMLIALNVPTAGCWEVTARYENTSVRYVIRAK